MKYSTIQLKKHRIITVVVAAVLCAQLVIPALTAQTHASSLSKVLVRFDRMQQSTGAPDVFTSGTVCLAASAAGAGTEDRVKVSFPAGMTVSTTTSNWATNTTSSGAAWPTGAQPMPTPGGAGSVGSSTALSAASQDVTWKISDLTDTQLYCFNWTNNTTALKTNTSTGDNQQGTVTTQTSAPATIDTNTFQTSTIANDSVVVTATVNQNFTFALSAFTDPLGSLSIGSPSTSGTPRTITLNTNAPNGWLVWGKDSNQGLNSTTAGYTIASNGAGSPCVGSNSTLAGGSEGYNLGLDSSQTSGTGTISYGSGIFQRSSTNYKGGGLCSGNFQTLVSSNGTANNAVLTLYNSASINGATKPATDYTDTETFVGAGMF